MRGLGNEQEAARLHYLWCSGCGEYKSHAVNSGQVCSGNCGLVVHDDPKCPLVGKVIGHMHTPECFDC